MARAGVGAVATGPAQLRVLGSPIAHSKSPQIHAAAYDVLGLDWTYDRDEVGAAEFEAYLASHAEEWRGFSVTMPLKEEAHRLATLLDPVAQESGVVNTLLRLDTTDARWAGFNTDVAGLASAISLAGLDATRTLVIGSGATAVSAVLAARKLGATHVEVAARNMEAVAQLIERFAGSEEPGSGVKLGMSGTNISDAAAMELLAGGDGAPSSAQPFTLVISTLPGSAAASVTLPAALTEVPLFDVAYDPWPSPFAAQWEAAGGRAFAGIGMLIEQALIQVRVFVLGDSGAKLDGEDAIREAMWRAAGAAPGTSTASSVGG